MDKPKPKCECGCELKQYGIFLFCSTCKIAITPNGQVVKIPQQP